MNDKSNSDKLKGLSEMMDRMEKENEKKLFEQGDRQAGQKVASLVYFKEMLNSSCKHEWVSGECGRLRCIICGEDGGSPWDC
jgi:hypothetical protein